MLTGLRRFEYHCLVQFTIFILQVGQYFAQKFAANLRQIFALAATKIR
jgi:hypothetical protein